MTDRPSRELLHYVYATLYRHLIRGAASGGEQPTGVGFVTSGIMHTEAYRKLTGSIQDFRC